MNLSEAKRWVSLCSQLQQWNASYQGQFLERRVWRNGLKIQSAIEKALVKEGHSADKRILIPMRFLTPVYRLWIQDTTIRDLLTQRLRVWIKENIQSSKPRARYTPQDIRLLLQLSFDLDLPEEYQQIHQWGQRVAKHEKWSRNVSILWKQVM